MIRFILLLVVIHCLGFLAHAAPKGPDVSTWSLRYLARSSNSLLVASNQAFESKAVLSKMQKKNVSKASHNLKAIIDERISKLSKKEVKEIRTQAKKCASECSCDIFAYYLEKSSDAADKKLLAQITPSAEKMSSKSRLACAQKFKEFCSSNLLKTISK